MQPGFASVRDVAGMENMYRLHTYEIRVEGHLLETWSEWFECLSICNDSNGETVLSGAFEDQAALFGTLAKFQGINLILISVSRHPEQ